MLESSLESTATLGAYLATPLSEYTNKPEDTDTIGQYVTERISRIAQHYLERIDAGDATAEQQDMKTALHVIRETYLPLIKETLLSDAPPTEFTTEHYQSIQTLLQSWKEITQKFGAEAPEHKMAKAMFNTFEFFKEMAQEMLLTTQSGLCMNHHRLEGLENTPWVEFCRTVIPREASEDSAEGPCNIAYERQRNMPYNLGRLSRILPILHHAHAHSEQNAAIAIDTLDESPTLKEIAIRIGTLQIKIDDVNAVIKKVLQGTQPDKIDLQTLQTIPDILNEYTAMMDETLQQEDLVLAQDIDLETVHRQWNVILQAYDKAMGIAPQNCCSDINSAGRFHSSAPGTYLM